MCCSFNRTTFQFQIWSTTFFRDISEVHLTLTCADPQTRNILQLSLILSDMFSQLLRDSQWDTDTPNDFHAMITTKNKYMCLNFFQICRQGTSGTQLGVKKRCQEQNVKLNSNTPIADLKKCFCRTLSFGRLSTLHFKTLSCTF